MPTAYCLLNHALTENQKAELANDFGCENCIYPSEELKALWSAVPTDKFLTQAHLEPFASWLSEAKADDVVVLQGEFGMTFALVDYALGRRLVPVHAVTKRIAKEERDGELVHRSYVFEHVCFRRYKRYSELE
ncbi:CRISPR-associated protein Csx20 [Leadbettera azotonutricia]|uniref:Uncharacterized protein n=1 Tax=Leadbettera azotonutricia (strain ATCC BAA-888 / DSM 13862 / ZAS-9) TaxID=545695 RepID=F5YCJ0_LEAAZ|nr:CRISPR-associated protein Csx20 [Leadbettera azotonutricia]AEF81047.1 conserved hypothetical protein [Leadbettera azotonutricia ZAS-9]